MHMELLSIIDTEYVALFQSWGYVGLFLATFLASSIVPFPSGVVFVMCVSDQSFNPLCCILIATLGNTMGSLILFSLGRLGKLRWLCTYGRIKPQKLRKFVNKAKKWGPPLALTAFIPGVGQALVVALGFLHCDTLKCATFIAIGKLIRYILFTLLTLGIVTAIV